MATSTLLQCLNEGSEFGVEASNRSRFETFIASETVAAEDTVSLDLSKTDVGDKAIFIKKAGTGDTATMVPVGVVVRSAESDGSLGAGSRVLVCTRGLVDAKVTGTVAQGDTLAMTATDGQLDNAVAATDKVVAIAAAARTGAGTVKVYVCNLL